jgi:hypothetical protein
MKRYGVMLLAIASCGGATVAPSDAGPGSDVTSGADSTGGSSGSSSGSVGGHEDGGSEDGSMGTPEDGAVTDAPPGPPDVTTTAPDDAGSPPAAGSPACVDVPCVICADGYYHCHSLVFPPCPAGLSTSTSCSGDNIPTYGCFWCPSEGNGWLWQCGDGGGWILTNFACTP